MRVVKEKDGGIVRRVLLVDKAGEVAGPPTRFLGHLIDAGYSPHTVSAYGYDLRQLFEFLDSELLDWRDFDPPAGPPRLELYVQNEQPETSGKPRPLQTLAMVDLSAFGRPRQSSLRDLSVGSPRP